MSSEQDRELPLPPTEMSSDGREVWAWADALSKETHRRHRMRQLSNELAVIGRRCGDCDNWMKKSQCPSEVNVGGMNRGPSCSAPICGRFVETRDATARRERIKAELESLDTRAAAALAKGEGKV